MGCGCSENTNPCTQSSPCGNCKIKLDSSCITYNGEDLTCLGIDTNENLNTVIQAVAERACGSSPATLSIENIGDGAEIYKGNSNTGAKQLRTLIADDSIAISTTNTTIGFAVNTDWLSDNVTGLIFPPNIVAFSTNNPNGSGNTFTPDNPADPDVLYWSESNNSIWRYNDGSGLYTVASVANATPFYYATTTTDAGGNKLADIKREGAIGIGVDPKYPLDVNGAIAQRFVTNNIVKAANDGKLIAAVAGTDYLAPNGSAAQLTNFPTLNQDTTGRAATVITNANLSGDVTSIGNTTTLGNTTVVAGTYYSPNITINSQGRITSATNSGGARALKDTYTLSQNTGSSSSTLFGYSLPVNTLANNGDKLEMYFAGNLPTTNSKTLSFSVGSNVYTIVTGVTLQAQYKLNVDLIRATSNTGVIAITLILDKSLPVAITSTFTVAAGWSTTTTINFNATGTSTGDIILNMGTIKYLPYSS